MLLFGHFTTPSNWNVQWVDLKVSSVLSEADECESDNVLLHWLLFVSQQFGNDRH